MTVDVYENCPIYENEYYMLRMTNKAVSYTHLDVYKRQVTLCAPASMAFSSSSLTTLAGRSTTSPAAMRSATVSYTHLPTRIART